MSQHEPRRTRRLQPLESDTDREGTSTGQAFEDLGRQDLSDHTNQHLAHIHDSYGDQLVAATQFVTRGLEQGEQCVIVLDTIPESDMRDALAEHGVNVRKTVDAGQIRFFTVDETYLRDGTFDQDRMLGFYTDLINDAVAEYPGLRVVAGTSWLADENTAISEFMEYESRVNNLFRDSPCVALCQYNREDLPADTIQDVIRTHPHLLYDNTICDNFYYIPPAQVAGPDEPDHEVNRMLRTLQDRALAVHAISDQEQTLQSLHTITSDPRLSFEEKLHAVFDLGLDRFGMELGALARVDTEADRFEIEHASGEHEHFEPGVELPLSETYCTTVTGIESAGSVFDPAAEGYDGIHVYEEFGLRAYLGTYVRVEGDTDRTFFFVTNEERHDGVPEGAYTLLRLMGQWVKYELEHQHREQAHRELYELAADTTRSFEEKLQALFGLGCSRFDLELGGLAQIDPNDDHFELEAVSADHDYLVPGLALPLSDTFCRLLGDQKETVGVADPRAAGLTSLRVHEEFGISAYVGTRIDLETGTDRTLFFASSVPRDDGVSDTERTFLRLMGQWVKYELERQSQDANLKAQARKQEVVAEFGQHAVDTPDLDDLFSEAVGVLKDTLGVAYCYVLEVGSGGDEFVERAGVGWDHDSIPVRGTDVTLDTQPGYTLHADTPVIVEDYGAESRFLSPRVLGDRVVGSGITTTIGQEDTPWGVLGVYDSDHRKFDRHDVNFVQSVASILASAIQRSRNEDRLQRQQQRYQRLVEGAPVAIVTCDTACGITYANPEAAVMAGVDHPSALVGQPALRFVHVDERVKVRDYVKGVIEDREGFTRVETRLVRPDGRLIHALITGVPVTEHDAPAAQIVVTDITEQKQIEQELRTQQEKLTYLDQLNETIREISYVAFATSDREAIEDVVCDQLAETYRFAWISEIDRRSNGVKARVWSGISAEALSEWASAVDEESRLPMATTDAIRTGQSQFLQPEHDGTLRTGHDGFLDGLPGNGVAVIPLTNEDRVYGVLHVHAEHPGFDDTETEILSYLGEVIGQAIHAVEQRRALLTDSVLEIDLHLEDLSRSFAEVCKTSSGSIRIDRTIPVGDGSVIQFYHVHGFSRSEFREAVSRVSEVENFSVIADREEELLVEVTVNEPGLTGVLVSFGGRLRRADFEYDELHLTAELPPHCDVREVVESLRDAYSGVEVRAQRTRTREVTTLRDLDDVIADALTEKQRVALETAYFMGFYDWPRTSTGEQVARLLGVSPATFTEHVRHAERKLLSALFIKRTYP